MISILNGAYQELGGGVCGEGPEAQGGAWDDGVVIQNAQNVGKKGGELNTISIVSRNISVWI